MIRLTIPTIEDDDFAAVREALASGYLVQGPRVAAFEEKLAASTTAKHCVVVSNCTSALQLALMALGIGAGDTVVVPTYSWPATANVVELVGAELVFVDIEPSTFNMSSKALEQKLDSLKDRRVRAIIPVHAFGQTADMTAIGALASARNIPIIEDAACALGATWNGKQAGTMSAMGCFSFHPRKAITTGEGGAITTDDAQHAAKLRALRNHGLDPAAPGPEFLLAGFNMRMTEMQAALGITQLAKLGRIVKARQRLAERYGELFAMTRVAAPRSATGAVPVYQSYVVTLPEDAAPRRAEIIAKLRERGVETTIGTWHIPLTKFYREKYGYKAGDFPGSESAFSRALTLPLFESMTDAQVDEVASKVLDVVG